MKILVISDIHANLTALETVLQSAGEVDATWCLGDIVGYGADLNECVERVRSLPDLLCIKGNHDLAICDTGNLEIFNAEASEAIRISRKIITPENINYLQDLPEVVTTDLATLSHGSPRNPIWEYVLDVSIAIQNLSSIDTQFAIVGHSHLPLLFEENITDKRLTRRFATPGTTFAISGRAILNPGSVGQPRDNDPRASFGILDPDQMSWEVHRVEYDIPAVQARILRAGLPEKHARRLSAGW